MTPITSQGLAASYTQLASEMMLLEPRKECEFNDDWVRRRSWKVVPVESAVRLTSEERGTIVSALRLGGYRCCVALFNEPGYIESGRLIVDSVPPGSMATCYEVAVSEEDFALLNRQLGAFRFLLMDHDRGWAISCNEIYNLYAGEVSLVSAMLGRPIERARQEFLEFAYALAKETPDSPLLRVSERYSSL